MPARFIAFSPSYFARGRGVERAGRQVAQLTHRLPRVSTKSIELGKSMEVNFMRVGDAKAAARQTIWARDIYQHQMPRSFDDWHAISARCGHEASLPFTM